MTEATTGSSTFKGTSASSIGSAAGRSGSGNAAIKIVAPFASLGATWAVRKMMDSGYRRATGSEPPYAGNPENTLRQALMWAAVTAAAIAAVNVMVDRATAQH